MLLSILDKYLSINDMKILLSWYAFQNDFENGAVSTNSPTLQFHRHFFEYDRHIILSSSVADDTRLDLILNQLYHEFPERRLQIESRYMDVPGDGIINPSVIRPKIEALLQEIADHELFLFISPGTPAMQVVWYMCHASLGLRTHLLQTVAPKHNKGTPRLVRTDVDMWPEPVAAIIRQDRQNRPAKNDDYLLTASVQVEYDKADKIAEAEKVTCLIQGASGTGKENLARYIHKQSARSSQPFIAINCASLGNELLESRLFGHKKGAFTGAVQDRKGLFEEAHGGTIFLDEIGDITPYMQQSLLRVVQEGEILPVGSTTSIKIDVRLISATHRDLRAFCTRELFRWDLFYRLSTTELNLPTVADRGLAEKRQLIIHLIKRRSEAYRRKKPLIVSADAWKLIDTYPFPGNVREIENLIDTLYVFAKDEVDVNDLPNWLRQPISVVDSYNWQVHEKQLIQRALIAFNGNKTKTYQALGYGSVNTLKQKMSDYDLSA